MARCLLSGGACSYQGCVMYDNMSRYIAEYRACLSREEVQVRGGRVEVLPEALQAILRGEQDE